MCNDFMPNRIAYFASTVKPGKVRSLVNVPIAIFPPHTYSLKVRKRDHRFFLRKSVNCNIRWHFFPTDSTNNTEYFWAYSTPITPLVTPCLEQKTYNFFSMIGYNTMMNNVGQFQRG